jgi:hypothetical protein
MKQADSTHLLQPLNIVRGWKVKENRLLENEDYNKKETGILLRLEYNYAKDSIEVIREKDYYQLEITREENQIPRTLKLQTQKELVDELERAIWYLDSRDDMDAPLDYIPLRIASGWNVVYNMFINVDPDSLNEQDDQWIRFKDEFLHLQYDEGRIIIDFGWQDEFDPNGCYWLGLVIDEKWDAPEKLLKIRRPEEVTKAIEDLMDEVASGKYDKPTYNN